MIWNFYLATTRSTEHSLFLGQDGSDVLSASGVVGCGREIEIEAFPLLAVICLGLNSKGRPLLGLTIHYHVMFTEHSTQLVKTPPLCRKKIFSCQEQLSRAAHAKRHLMETPLVILTGHQLHNRDFQGPGRRQAPTATSPHRQPDHSVLGRNGAGVFLFSVIGVS